MLLIVRLQYFSEILLIDYQTSVYLNSCIFVCCNNHYDDTQWVRISVSLVFIGMSDCLVWIGHSVCINVMGGLKIEAFLWNLVICLRKSIRINRIESRNSRIESKLHLILKLWIISINAIVSWFVVFGFVLRLIILLNLSLFADIQSPWLNQHQKKIKIRWNMWV